MKRIADTIQLQDLPEDPDERLERLLDFVGQDIIGIRNEAFEQIFKELDRESWNNLLPFDAKFFRKASDALDDEQREIARKLAERVLTYFMTRFMTMISCHGQNNPLGPEHGMQYRFGLELQQYPTTPTERSCRPSIDSDVSDPIEAFEPVDNWEEHDIDSSSPSESFDLTSSNTEFAKYWHHWQHQYKDY